MDLTNYISDMIRGAIQKEYQEKISAFLDSVMNHDLVAQEISREELESLLVFPEIMVISCSENEKTCMARTISGERCSRKRKYGTFCGAHRRAKHLCQIDSPYLSTDLRPEDTHSFSLSSEPTIDEGILLHQYVKTEHVEIEGVQYYLDRDSGVLFESPIDGDSPIIKGRLNLEEGTLSLFN